MAVRDAVSPRSRRSLAVLLIAGAGLIAALAVWQTLRATERARWIVVAEQRLALAPQALPGRPDRAEHAFLPVRVRGRFDHAAAQRAYHFDRGDGPGYRLVTPMDTASGRRILVDRGFVADDAQEAEAGGSEEEIVGILYWPREKGPFTPERDPRSGLWYARNLPAMAEVVGAEAVLVVARGPSGGVWPRAEPPAFEPGNRHIGYAFTWAALATIWTGMIGLLWRRAGRGE